MPYIRKDEANLCFDVISTMLEQIDELIQHTSGGKENLDVLTRVSCYITQNPTYFLPDSSSIIVQKYLKYT